LKSKAVDDADPQTLAIGAGGLNNASRNRPGQAGPTTMGGGRRTPVSTNGPAHFQFRAMNDE